jgi:hypothetical protein
MKGDNKTMGMSRFIFISLLVEIIVKLINYFLQVNNRQQNGKSTNA